MVAVAILAFSMAPVGVFLREHDRSLASRGASQMTRAAEALGYGVPTVVVLAASLGG